ncbi:hypothetical protein CLOM_g1589 [Closterium sp. NIES-68]|nr:hypothetical protein CLOM_g1589 [Closterium sp. NIES-68]GJP58350.1 hypothetical protein CLOP_g23273 [Closterium sp. NIES-67]
MSERIPLTSTPSEPEGSYSPPSQHSPEHSSHDGDDVKVTVAEKLVSDADFRPLKTPEKEGGKGTEDIDATSGGGWNEFDQSSAIFNFHERPVRDAGWRFVFLVPLVLLVAMGALSLVGALFNPPLLFTFLLTPLVLLLLFALSLPFPLLLVSSLRGTCARTIKVFLIIAAVICALQSATSAVHFLVSPLAPSVAEQGPYPTYAPYSPGSMSSYSTGSDGSSSEFPVDSNFAESADGENGDTMGGGGGDMMAGEGVTEGGTEGGTGGAPEGWVEGQEDPYESPGSSADDAAAEADSSSSSSSSSTSVSDLGRGLLELVLPAIAHPVVAVTAHHTAHWARATHSMVHRQLQGRASVVATSARGRSLQGPPQLPAMPSMARLAELERPLYFIGFMSFALLSALALLLVLRFTHHLSLIASAVAHTAHATIAQAPIILFMALPVMLAGLVLSLPLIDFSSHLVVSILLSPFFVFALKVLATLFTYSVAAIYARLYVTTSTSSGGSEGMLGGEGEKRMTVKGQLELFRSAFSLACTSSLGTCCAIATADTAVIIVQLILSALAFALFGQGVIGCMLVALLRCAEVAIEFFLHCLVLPTCAMSGHGFSRSVRLSLDILQRFTGPIVAVNASALALLVMVTVPLCLINTLIGLFGAYVWMVLFLGGPGGLGLGALLISIVGLLAAFAVSLLSMVALSYVLTTGVATTVLCFAWDKKLDAEDGSDAAGLVAGGSISSADLKANNKV